MGQKGFFDVERRLEAISALSDPLETIRKRCHWEDFRSDIEAVTETKPEERRATPAASPLTRSSSSRSWCCGRSTISLTIGLST
jgi:hypothetical protein